MKQLLSDPLHPVHAQGLLAIDARPRSRPGVPTSGESRAWFRRRASGRRGCRFSTRCPEFASSPAQDEVPAERTEHGEGREVSSVTRPGSHRLSPLQLCPVRLGPLLSGPLRIRHLWRRRKKGRAEHERVPAALGGRTAHLVPDSKRSAAGARPAGFRPRPTCPSISNAGPGRLRSGRASRAAARAPWGARSCASKSRRPERVFFEGKRSAQPFRRRRDAKGAAPAHPDHLSGPHGVPRSRECACTTRLLKGLRSFGLGDERSRDAVERVEAMLERVRLDPWHDGGPLPP